MTFALVQHAATAAGTNAFTQAFGSNITAGHLLLIVSTNNSANGTLSVDIANTGTAGVQVWHPMFPSPIQGGGTRAVTTQMWWALASGTGSCTVTMTWTANNGEIYVQEFSGAPAALVQDGLGQSALGTAASILLPSLTTAGADDLVVGFVNCGNTGTPQSPWSNVDGTFSHPVFYRADVAAGTYTPNVTQTSSTYMSLLVALGVPPVVNAPAPNSLPFRLGPKAVGPRFFAAHPPNQNPTSPNYPSTPPPIGGTGTLAATLLGNLLLAGGPFPTPPVSSLAKSNYLPRTLGPKAVGPTFFAALYEPPTPPTVGGPATLTASTTDTSLSSTVCTRIWSGPRAVADTSLSTTVDTETTAQPRATTDTSLSSDVASRSAQLFTRSTADTSASSDITTRVILLPRSVSDTSLSVDSVTPLTHEPRATADTSATSDVLSRGTLIAARAIADASLSTDSLTRIEREPRSVADTSASSDALSRSALLLTRATADISLSSDTITRTESEPRSVSDTSLSSDTVTSAKGYARSTADTSLSTDSLTRNPQIFARTVGDTSISTTTAVRVLLSPRSIADTSLSTESTVAVKGVGRFPTDTSLSTDSVSRVLLFPSRSTADSSLSADVVSRIIRFPRSSADSSTSVDAITRVVALSRATSDTSLSSDATTRGALHYARTSADTSLSTEVSSTILRESRSVSDTSLSSDTTSRHPVFARTFADTSLSANVVSRSIRFPRTTTDTSHTFETFVPGSVAPPPIQFPTKSALQSNTTTSFLESTESNSVIRALISLTVIAGHPALIEQLAALITSSFILQRGSTNSTMGTLTTTSSIFPYVRSSFSSIQEISTVVTSDA